jgi:AcrR family transcriptional regulator
VPTPVKKRAYDATRRRAAALETRRAVLRAARDLFLDQGYAATSVARVARRAGVSVDTVYTSVGRKPELLLAVVDMVLAHGDEPVPAEERGYVRDVRAATTAREKIGIYAEALAVVLPPTVPLLQALRAAGATDDSCLEMATRISERRAANMLLLAADLRMTGELRDDLTDQQVADLIWSMNSPDYYALVTGLGRTPQEFAALLADVWTRTLLRS